MATGNTARVYKLNRGLIAEGREADLVVVDAPLGSVGKDALSAIAAGDNPGVSLVLVDGKIVVDAGVATRRRQHESRLSRPSADADGLSGILWVKGSRAK